MKVLLADDSQTLCRIISDIILRNFPEAEIFIAYDGQHALTLESSEQPDILLLDVVMPVMSGIDVLSRLQDRLTTGRLYTIMITSQIDDETLKSCFSLGARDFIRKPINEVELCSRLEGAMRSIKLIKELKNSKALVTSQNETLTQINFELMNAKNQMVQSEKLAAIGQLAAGIAHEINNPIGFISSNLEILNQYFKTLLIYFNSTSKHFDVTSYIDSSILKEITFITDDVPELFSDTKIGVERITEIINGLRSFSRIDMTNAFDYFDVNQGIKDTLIVARHKYKYAVEVSTNLRDIPMIHAYGGKLNQVFMNLIVNAVDAIVEKRGENGDLGSLVIETYERNNSIVISFKDDGIGMSESTKMEIFNPFFTTKNIGKGTGLGLSMTYDIITNEHKGDISVKSELGVGTEFIITLPQNLRDQLYCERESSV